MFNSQNRTRSRSEVASGPLGRMHQSLHRVLPSNSPPWSRWCRMKWSCIMPQCWVPICRHSYNVLSSHFVIASWPMPTSQHIHNMNCFIPHLSMLMASGFNFSSVNLSLVFRPLQSFVKLTIFTSSGACDLLGLINISFVVDKFFFNLVKIWLMDTHFVDCRWGDG